MSSTLQSRVATDYQGRAARANLLLDTSISSSNTQLEGLHVTFDARAKSPSAHKSMSSPILGDGDTEKVLCPLMPPKEVALINEQFPSFAPNPKPNQKSRSLTQAEINMGVITEDEVAALGEQLQTDPPPMSLQEARERRASIKEERKRSIDFIRRRTSSRAAAMGRPSLDSLEESQRTAASGGSSLEVLKEGQQK
jgi:hypothetical protein